MGIVLHIIAQHLGHSVLRSAQIKLCCFELTVNYLSFIYDIWGVEQKLFIFSSVSIAQLNLPEMHHQSVERWYNLPNK